MKQIFLSFGFCAALACSSGPAKAEIYKMKVTAFDALSLKIPADVEWVDSDNPSCIVECSAENEAKFEVVMDGNTLVIKSKGDSWKSDWSWGDDKKGKIIIKLSSSRLQRINISGSGDVVMKSNNDSPSFEYNINGSGDLKAMVDAKNCKGSINGSGDAQINGKAEEFDLSINGSGDVKAYDFSCTSVNVKIAGSGDAQVQATENLDVKISGSGDVSYKGNPKTVNNKVAGSGEIRKAG